ncbi:MAG: hypothetical protein R6U99_04635 [Nioella sp.]
MRDHAYFDADSGAIGELETLTSQRLDTDKVPHAVEVQSSVPIYDMDALRPMPEEGQRRRALMAEWAWVLGQGPGAVVLRKAYADTAPIDRATAGVIAVAAERAHKSICVQVKRQDKLFGRTLIGYHPGVFREGQLQGPAGVPDEFGIFFLKVISISDEAR